MSPVARASEGTRACAMLADREIDCESAERGRWARDPALVAGDEPHMTGQIAGADPHDFVFSNTPAA